MHPLRLHWGPPARWAAKTWVKTNTNKRHRNVVATTSFHARRRASETFRVMVMFLTVLFPPKKDPQTLKWIWQLRKLHPKLIGIKNHEWILAQHRKPIVHGCIYYIELVLKRAMENLGQNWFHENLHTLRLRGRTNFQVALLKLGNSTTQCRLP